MPKTPINLEQGGEWVDAVAPRRSNLSQLVFPYTHATSGVWLHKTESVGKFSATTRVGVVFLGRQSPGCHNVICGLRRSCGSSSLVGILGGSAGLIGGKFVEISPEIAAKFINQGGIELLGRSEMPLKTRDELAKCAQTCQTLRLDGLVVVGGIGTHADTALLAEVLGAHKVPTRVIGVPASVENDIPFVEQTLGHDTATRVVASIIGSIATLAASSKRQWCFVRVNGYFVSHILANAALLTHPHLVLITEEVGNRRMSLSDIVNAIANLVAERAAAGFDFGILVFAESVLEKVPEISDPRMASTVMMDDSSAAPAAAEILLQSLVARELHRRKMFAPTSVGSFVSSTFCIGSQSRSSLPSDFDCDLGFTMGLAAGSMIQAGKSGLMINVSNLGAPAAEWIVSGIPLTNFLAIEGTLDPVSGCLSCLIEIREKLVDSGFCDPLLKPSLRRFVNPGPLQLFCEYEAFSSKQQKQNPADNLSKQTADLVSRLLSIAATASDESTRKVIQTGLDHALAIVDATAPTRPSCGPLIVFPPALNKHPESMQGSLRRHGSHCRIVHIVPC